MSKQYTNINLMLDYVEANIIVSRLRNQNIDCFLADEHSAVTSLAPSAITARIMVNKKDLARAQKIIKDFFKNTAE